MENLKSLLDQFLASLLAWLASPTLYFQLALIATALISAYAIAAAVKRYLPVFAVQPEQGALLWLRAALFNGRSLLFPLFTLLSLAVMADVSKWLFAQDGVLRSALGAALVVVIYTLISRYVGNRFFATLLQWIAIPIAILQVVGWLHGVVFYLESLSVELGNIKISAYGVVRVSLFGAVLFWLGRISNRVGQRIIRQQASLDAGAREIFAKLYQVAVALVIFVLLLQIMGINITTLAVFGGALGVGLGFGLQSIASNFISGLILLLDRSLAEGDYIELADGRKGTIRELNMRSTTLETYDGKDIMVPNEQFITTSFTNWTHKNKKQRYAIEFQVAYSTDLHALFDLLRAVVSSHPKVLSGGDIPIEERPDAEISGFGESGVNILIEFWMEGIDDGEHRVGGDLYLMIWDALKANHIQIPFPQREVKIVTVGEPPAA